MERDSTPLPQRLQAALDAHEVSIDLLLDLTSRLETAQAVPRQEAEQVLSGALECGRRLRDVLHEADMVLAECIDTPDSRPFAEPTRLEDLRGLVAHSIAQVTLRLNSLPRARIERLLMELREGEITDDATWRLRIEDQKRLAAAEELAETLKPEATPIEAFPGPDSSTTPWLPWFWSLGPVPQGEVVESVAPRWPRLVDFLVMIDPTRWRPGEAASQTQASEPPEPGPESTPKQHAGTPPRTPPPPLTSRPSKASGREQPTQENPANLGPTSATGRPRALDDLLGGVGVGAILKDGQPTRTRGRDASEPVGKAGTPEAAETADSDSDSDITGGTEGEGGTRAPVAEVNQRVGESLHGPAGLDTGNLLQSGPAPLKTAEPKRDDTRPPEGSEPDNQPTPPSGPTAASQARTTQSPGKEALTVDRAHTLPRASLADAPDLSASKPAPGTGSRKPLTLDALPKALTLESFQGTFWLGANAEPIGAPWTAPEFGAKLSTALEAAVIEEDWPAAYIYTQAARALGWANAAGPELLDAVRSFGQGLRVEMPDGVDQVVARLVGAADNASQISPVPGDWFWLTLLVFGAPQCPLDYGTVGQLGELANLSPSCVSLLQEWLVVAQGGRAFEQLSVQVEGPSASPATLAAQLQAAGGALRLALKEKFKAAGGRIKTTHCRDAWDTFMAEAHPVLVRISAPDVQAGDLSLLDSLRSRATHLFDRLGARFQDRRKMDKAVDELLQLAHRVIDIHAELAALSQDTDVVGDPLVFSERAIAALTQEQRECNSLSGWVARLLWSHTHNDYSYGTHTDIDNDRLRSKPLLVEAWKDFSFDMDGLDPRQVDHPVRAAARLLENNEQASLDDLEAWLAQHRPDLLPTSGPLQPESTRRSLAYKETIEDEQHELAARCRALVLRLSELADEQFRIAELALERIERATDEPLSALEVAWLRHTTSTLTERVRRTTGHLVERAIEEGRDPEEVQRIAESGQLSGLLRLLGEQHSTGSTRQMRATHLRSAAARLWPLPAYKLAQLTGNGDVPLVDEGSVQVVAAWKAQRHALKRRKLDPGEATTLREAFAEFIFQMTAKRRKNRVRSYTPQGDNTHYHQVHLNDVRNWLVENVGNPTFLPQLARYSTLALKVAPVSARDRGLPRRVHREATADEITVVLVPGLEPEQRDQVMDYLSTQPFIAPVAVMDDLDLCRILNPDGDAPDPLLATLEIVAEQQPWGRFCPYEVVEGQHVRLEMFVGRMKEAERLARQATYGRIFSGRRLGKTALLRFVEGHSHFSKLPSGNDLHIVFCAIAGEETEGAVSRSIIKSVRQHLNLRPLDEEDLADPVACLKDWVPQLLRERPSDSWLILLDEADSFFAAQIGSAMGDRQQSLSWWMSRHSEEITDANGVPRIRFVFCGYLRTDQNRGVWENKGDVLLLRPLEAQDAVLLAAGPLARIGIDAREQADNIAFQCGYQPAVLVRFGLTMVDHLERTRARQEREGVVVKSKDVHDVFLSNGVQKAIEEACWLNFVGHPTGQLVFAAFLMELRDRVPFAALDDVPTRLLHRIGEATQGFDPTEYFSDNWHDLVVQQLKELVDRSLLVQAGHRPATYRLRFPHHRPVLLQQDPGQRVRDALLRLRKNGRELQSTWILPQGAIDDIRFSLGDEGRALGVRAVVVASQWQAPLLDEGTGLRPRVGTTDSGVVPLYLVDDQALQALDRLHDLDQPAILVGGPAVARKALSQHVLSGEVEVVRTGRLSSEQVLEWFQRRRAAEFEGLAAPSRIMQATGGVPLLVGALDTALGELFPSAPTLGLAELDRLLARLEADLPRIRAELHAESAPSGLLPREIELLQMIRAASAEYGDQELMGEALEDGLIELPAGVEPYRPEDAAALRLLLALGLLPRAPTGAGKPLHEVGLVSADDPLYRLLGVPTA